MGVVGVGEYINAKQEHILSDKDALQIYEMRLKARRDFNGMQRYALDKGHEEGFAESKLEIARKMKNAGKPFSEISEFTGLSSDVIENL